MAKKGEKKFKKYLEVGDKNAYLCTRFPRLTSYGEQGSEKSLKNLSKRFGGLRKRYYLCTTFRLKKAGKLKRGLRASDEQARVLTTDRTTFFEDIEQQSFSTLLRRVISKQYL